MAPLSRLMCFGGNGKHKDDPDVKRSREIEKQLREDEKRMAKEVKILLLGRQCLVNIQPAKITC